MLNLEMLFSLNPMLLVSYFLWDALDAIINFVDFGFVAHGVACFIIFLLSFVRVFSPSSILHSLILFFSRNHLWHTMVPVYFSGNQVPFS